MWTNVGKWIALPRAVADGDIINVIMGPNSESILLGNGSSIEETAIGKISWAKAANAYSTLLKFA